MARKYVGEGKDLNWTELNKHRLQNLASAPSSPAKGWIYFNSTTNVPEVWDGSAWLPWGGITLEQVRDDLASVLVAGNNIDITVDDGANTITFAVEALTTADLSDFATAADTIADASAAAAVAAVIDSAPGALDTLNELAAALGDDANFASTVTTALGTKATKFSANIGDGSTNPIVVTHNLGTKDVVVAVREVSGDAHVDFDVTSTSTTTATLAFLTAPTTNQYRVTVLG